VWNMFAVAIIGTGNVIVPRIHAERLDPTVWEYAGNMRKQCTEALKQLAQTHKMWASRKPILDAHIFSLLKKAEELEQEIDEIVMERAEFHMILYEC